MNRKTTRSPGMMALATMFAAAGMAAAQELSLQGGTTTGGDQNTVGVRNTTGTSYASFMSVGSSYGELVLPSGAVVARQTVEAMCNGAPLGKYRLSGIARIPDGRVRVFMVANSAWGYAGCYLRLRRADGSVIDTDPIVSR